MIVPSGAEVAARLRSERNQGRAADMGWLDHGGLGFNYRLSDLAAALGVAQVEKLDALLGAARRASPRSTRERPGRDRGRRGADRRPRRGAAQLVRLRRPPRRRGRPRRDDRPPRRARHRQQGLPALHPPLPAPARARLPRGPVPGRRSGLRPLAGAALLPGDERGPGGPRLRGSRRQSLTASCPMSRFRKDPDPRFWRAQPLARVRLAAGALRHRPVAGPRPRPARDRRPRRGRAGADRRRSGAGAGADGRARLRVRRRRRGHPHGDRAPARRGDRAARRQAPHRPLAQRPGRHRRGDGRPGALAAGDRALRRGDGAPAGARRGHRDWPMPGYTHLQRAQPVYLGHHLLAYFWMLARDVLRFQFALDSASVMPLGSGALAGVNWEIDRERGRRRPRLRARQPQLDRRRLQPRLRPRLPGRRLDLRDAPLAPRLGDRDLVEHASSASASSTSPSPRAPRSCRRR